MTFCCSAQFRRKCPKLTQEVCRYFCGCFFIPCQEISFEGQLGDSKLHYHVERYSESLYRPRSTEWWRISEILNGRKMSIINYRDKYMGGETALHNACFNEKVTLIEMICKAGADVNIRDDRDFTPVMAAVCSIPGNEDKKLISLKWLVHRKADLNAKRKSGDTALKQARKRGYMKVVEFLLDNGAIDDDPAYVPVNTAAATAAAGPAAAVDIIPAAAVTAPQPVAAIIITANNDTSDGAATGTKVAVGEDRAESKYEDEEKDGTQQHKEKEAETPASTTSSTATVTALAAAASVSTINTAAAAAFEEEEKELLVAEPSSVKSNNGNHIDTSANDTSASISPDSIAIDIDIVVVV